MEMKAQNQLALDMPLMAKVAELAITGGCTRRKIGCLIVAPVRERGAIGYRIAGQGVNTTPGGGKTCDEVGCLLGVYNGRERCMRTIHSEISAIADAAKNGLTTVGGTAYMNIKPCLDCGKALLQAGIVRVVYCGVNEAIPAEYAFLLQDMSFDQFPAEEWDRIVSDTITRKQWKGNRRCL